jgi:hypothetical protein
MHLARPNPFRSGQCPGMDAVWEQENSKRRKCFPVQSRFSTCRPFTFDTAVYRWASWIDRLGRDPFKPNRVVALLKRQESRCMLCGLRFITEDRLEVHHRNGDHHDNAPANLVLLHVPYHDEVHRTNARDKSLFSKEPDEAKVSFPVR